MTELENPTTTITEFQVLNDDLNLPITYVIDQFIPIIDGRIKLYIKDFNVIFDIKVKQVKGRGAYYADKFRKPYEDHLEILRAWIAPDYRDIGLTINQVYYMIRKARKKNNEMYEVKPAPIQARISELMRKGVLEHRENMYYLVYDYACKIITEKKF